MADANFPTEDAVRQPRGRPSKKQMEEKHAEWHKLSVERMTKVLSYLEASIKPLTSRERYFYTDSEWQQVVGALRNSVDEIEQEFKEGGKRKPKVVFSFDEAGPAR